MDHFKKYDRITGWIVFAVAALVYLLTMEPSASLWDCAEFIATSYKLEVGHPPGAPLFMMIARFFTMFAPKPEYAAVMVNSMSALASAFTILFLYWSITHLGRRIITLRGGEMTAANTWTVIGAGIVGSLAYTFTDTFWFSAVEGEVYALSSLFTALVVWAMLKWEEAAGEPHANRWLVLIAYLMGLSIGVHILNLLTIPALVFIYYFKKTPKVTVWGVVKATLIAAAILLFINNIVIPYTAAAGAVVDRWFVNGLGLPVNSGLLVFMLVLFGLLGAGVYYTYKRGKAVWNTILLCLTVILIGYSSYASVVIRASANPPMNSNDPDNAYGLLYLLNRDQYGTKPLLFGAQYSAPIEDVVYTDKYYLSSEDGKYEASATVTDYEYPNEFITFFPRMWSANEAHIEGYKEWGRMGDGKKISYMGERYSVPTWGENMRFFMNYQLNFMYWRYFLWNFVGRQSDVQSLGEITDGQWLSGIKPIDRLYLGPQDGLPSEMAGNKGRNVYYFLPFILGLIGLIYQLNRDPRNFTVVMWLFIMMGIALVFYFNTTPSEPRERDYVYAGSFYAFSIWIGLGVMCVREWISKLSKRDNVATAVAATVICSCVPVILAAQNWDDHDRSHRYVARDIGYNHLMTCLPNSIIMNYGDNDTFPLWYNQEVEGVRPDVRIMNMSYLDGSWYVDEMKYRYNESAPVPFSLPQHKYAMSENDFVYIEDVFSEPKSVRQVIDFVRGDEPVSRIRLNEKTAVDFIPTRTLLLPVNRENAIKSGIVKPQDAHLMVDTIVMNLRGSTLRKSELMVLDLLANFDWERPLYFTTPSMLAPLGLQDYLQFDGFAYRLVPIKTPYTDSQNVGRIDPDVLYENLMNVYRYGNVADPRVYVDYFTNYNFAATHIRTAFSRLAMELAARGDKEKAVEVLDYGLEQIPVSQFSYTYQYLPYIAAYYEAGAIDKGDALFDSYSSNLEEYVTYFLSFPANKQYLIENQLTEKLSVLAELHRIAEDYGRTDRAQRILTLFDWIFGPEDSSQLQSDEYNGLSMPAGQMIKD